MRDLAGLGHLFVCVFLYNFAAFMVLPAITDVTLAALCPGRDQCGLAIYLTGFQQAITGMGTLLVTPLLGNLSDRYGRKAVLTLPMCIAVVPLAVLAYSRSKTFFYVYYAAKTFAGVLCEGSMQCLPVAYVVSATAAVSAAVYMRLFLVEPTRNGGAADAVGSSQPILATAPSEAGVPGEPPLLSCDKSPSLWDMIGLLRSSLTLLGAAILAFFSSLGDGGLNGSLLYYLKARFHFNKDQFADLLLIPGIAGAISQVFLDSIAWASWIGSSGQFVYKRCHIWQLHL